MSMGDMLDHFAFMAEYAGHIKAQAHRYESDSHMDNTFTQEYRDFAAKQAQELERRYREKKERLTELHQEIMQRYERFGGPVDVRVNDLRTGNHDRQAILEEER